MRFSRTRRQDIVGLLLIAAVAAVSAAAGAAVPGSATAVAVDDDSDPWIPAYHGRNVCEARTINYITTTLPELCLKTPLPTGGLDHPVVRNETTHAATSATDAPAAQQTASAPINEDRRDHHNVEGGVAAEGPAGDGTAASELDSKPFMSFEEWKEMMMKKTGQDPAQLRPKKTQDGKAETDAAVTSRDELDGSGEEDAKVDVDTSQEKASEPANEATSDDTVDDGKEALGKEVLYDDGKTQYYLSKDAGKTCKERFSYSSFDAGATILKTSKGAKNAKAILVENKDTYMLLECSAADKYVIVELSDDILVDTVVVANFEFFSSMIRHFRVSVSDRYPVKQDKWKVLGEFEARNSRDIQPFLVQHPQIWAKYIRVEFLTHWGNEYYCPVSLLRIHGTRMIESWKDSEIGRDDEDGEDNVAQSTLEAEPRADDATNTVVEDAPAVVETEIVVDTGEQQLALNFSSWMSRPEELYFQENFASICAATDSSRWPEVTETPEIVYVAPDSVASIVTTDGPNITHAPAQVAPVGQQTVEMSVPSSAEPRASDDPSSTTGLPSEPASSSSTSSTAHVETMDSAASPYQIKSAAVSIPPTPRSRQSSSSSAAAPSPTVQESFFKTVSKRLQVLESNTTMSLKYIEDQFKVMRDALLKIEKRQTTAVDSVLESLNNSATAEFRVLRQQYEQVWQSTVITLESNREQSRREILALSARLTILADEVVFQKRMAIIQSVLLLSCLALVIFSRGLAVAPVSTPAARLGGEPESSLAPALQNGHIMAVASTNDATHAGPADVSREQPPYEGPRSRAPSRRASSQEVRQPLTPVSDHSTPSESFEHHPLDPTAANNTHIDEDNIVAVQLPAGDDFRGSFRGAAAPTATAIANGEQQQPPHLTIAVQSIAEEQEDE